MGESTRWFAERPTNDTQLWDYLRWRFGVGDYDDVDDERPWYRYRMDQIIRLKAMRTKRKVSIDELVMTADYCYRYRITILHPYQLYRYIPEANRERRELQTSDLAQQIDSAIRRERALADRISPSWIDRLSRARGPYRKEVLLEWQRSRQIQTRDAWAS